MRLRVACTVRNVQTAAGAGPRGSLKEAAQRAQHSTDAYSRAYRCGTIGLPWFTLDTNLRWSSNFPAAGHQPAILTTHLALRALLTDYHGSTPHLTKMVGILLLNESS